MIKEYQQFVIIDLFSGIILQALRHGLGIQLPDYTTSTRSKNATKSNTNEDISGSNWKFAQNFTSDVDSDVTDDRHFDLLHGRKSENKSINARMHKQIISSQSPQNGIAMSASEN